MHMAMVKKYNPDRQRQRPVQAAIKPRPQPGRIQPAQDDLGKTSRQGIALQAGAVWIPVQYERAGGACAVHIKVAAGELQQSIMAGKAVAPPSGRRKGERACA
jgi:hypothetical protein